MEYRSIEIDMAVHKAIETARASFAESPNEVLHRLLGLGESRESRPAAVDVTPNSEGRAWLSKGLELPHGTKLRMSYNGATYTGEICDGKFLAEGKVYRSPSGAAGSVARTKEGAKVPLNGWYYWEAMKPGSRIWKRLSWLKSRSEV